MIKLRIRFVKRGSMIYVGHLDIMRYFQKLFRRCGFDVSYSQGFNPHQLMSFASPLGLGLTGISEYMDVTINSFYVVDTCETRVGDELSINEWIERINTYSTEMIYVTGMCMLDEKTKPSMSLLSACAYELYNIDMEYVKDLICFYNTEDQIIYKKQTKKSVKELDLKNGILAISDNFDDFIYKINKIAINDENYIRNNIPEKNGLFIMCISGSDINIKPEMITEYFSSVKNTGEKSFDIERIEMYTKKEMYISMSMDTGAQ